MRSRSTNILQVIVLITGLVYIIMGALFYISPLTVIEFFAENVSENWLDLVKDHELVSPLYYISRASAALLFSSGVAMVLPLFDPLKYRGLIYYNGLLFPFLASILFIKQSIVVLIKRSEAEAISSGAAMLGQQGHMIVIILGIIFIAITLITVFGLVITKKQSREGLE